MKIFRIEVDGNCYFDEIDCTDTPFVFALENIWESAHVYAPDYNKPVDMFIDDCYCGNEINKIASNFVGETIYGPVAIVGRAIPHGMSKKSYVYTENYKDIDENYIRENFNVL